MPTVLAAHQNSKQIRPSAWQRGDNTNRWNRNKCGWLEGKGDKLLALCSTSAILISHVAGYHARDQSTCRQSAFSF